MIFNRDLNPTYPGKWKRHFCLFPTRISDSEIVWLQVIRRRRTSESNIRGTTFYNYEYSLDWAGV